jgi:outer membrane biosynthesis protein TonB
MRQQLEYMIAAGLVAYIVFLTRPAPSAITSMLANPIAQLVALGAVVYMGARQSLLLALLLGLAFVLSTPTREYMDPTAKPKEKSKSDSTDTAKPSATPSVKPSTKPSVKPSDKPSTKPTDKAAVAAVAAAKPSSEKTEPDAAGQKVGKETFTSGIASTAAAF